MAALAVLHELDLTARYCKHIIILKKELYTVVNMEPEQSEQADLIGKGYIQVYTGNGKGKTTAILGLAFRAMGHDLKTYIGQFMKGQQYGELESAKMVSSYITIEQYGQGQFIHVKPTPDKADVDSAHIGMSKAADAMLSLDYDIVVMDEILTASYFKLVSVDDILAVINKKPSGVELVLTGRYAPQEIIDAADLVTEMVEVKHYYKKGVLARAGIER
ncbi:cob(I)yrinic acid a,c-diamide adenosyltransferase [Chloroflexota bacterium]